MANVGFAKPAGGKVIHVVIEGKQACDKKIALTSDPELNITSVTCKKCQRFAFYKELQSKATPPKQETPPPPKAEEKKPPKKKVVDAPKETPEEFAERIASQADKRLAKAVKKKEKDPVTAPGPVKHTKVNKNRKEDRNHKKLVQAIQENLLEILEVFQQEEIHQITLMRAFEETQTRLRDKLVEACENKDEKSYLQLHWTLDWRNFIKACEGVKFCKLKGKDPDKGCLVLLYDEKADKSERTIRRRNGSATTKTARTIRRRGKKQEEAKEPKEKKARKIRRRSEEDRAVKKNDYGHVFGKATARLDDVFEEGVLVRDAMVMLVKEFNRSDKSAERKVRKHMRSFTRKLGFKLNVIMGKDPMEDYIKIIKE